MTERLSSPGCVASAKIISPMSFTCRYLTRTVTPCSAMRVSSSATSPPVPGTPITAWLWLPMETSLWPTLTSVMIRSMKKRPRYIYTVTPRTASPCGTPTVCSSPHGMPTPTPSRPRTRIPLFASVATTSTLLLSATSTLAACRAFGKWCASMTTAR